MRFCGGAGDGRSWMRAVVRENDEIGHCATKRGFLIAEVNHSSVSTEMDVKKRAGHDAGVAWASGG